MATAIFDFEDGTSGKITKAVFTYSTVTGWDDCDTGQNTSTGWKWRAFFNFDTSSLDDSAVVSKVEFYQKLDLAQPLGDPDSLQLKYSLGTFIGDALGGSSDWEGGTYVHLETTEKNNQWIDISNISDPTGLVNTTGDTDLKVWDDSIKGDGDPSWGTNFNARSIKCQLRITYTIPAVSVGGENSFTFGGFD